MTSSLYFTKEIIYLLFDSMSFAEIINLSRVNRLTYFSSKSDEYWRQRITNIDKIPYLNVTSDDPRVNYAWSIVVSITDAWSIRKKFDVIAKVKPMDHQPDLFIYLSQRQDLLFPGLETLIGLNRFLERCVKHRDLDMLKYGFSLGPNDNTIRMTFDLSIKQKWSDWRKKFSPKVEIWFDVTHPCLSNNQMYLIDLLIKGEETEFLSIYRKNMAHISFDMVFMIGYHGTVSLVKSYVTNPPKEESGMSRSFSYKMRPYDDILRGAVDGNNIQLVKYILTQPIGYRIDIRLVITSKEMLDLLVESKRFPMFVLLRGVACGDNYRLFFDFCSKVKRKDFSKAFCEKAPPIMMKLLMIRSEKNPLTKCRDKSMIHIFPFQYNALRELGMPAPKMELIDFFHIGQHLPDYLDVEYLPYFKGDVVW